MSAEIKELNACYIGEPGWVRTNDPVIKSQSSQGNERHLIILPRIKGRSGFVFIAGGQSAVTGVSRANNRMDAAIIEATDKTARGSKQAKPTARWTFHDLGRACASGMARPGISLPVVENVMNHKSGSFAGTVGVYRRHDFADEKRAALETWAKFVLSVVVQKPAANDVTMPRRTVRAS
jgi:hypothetical protein